MDLHNYDGRYETAVKNLKKKNIPKSNKELILKFADNCFSESLSTGRIVKYIYNLATLSEMLGKKFEDADKEDIKRIVAEIEKRNYSPWTKRDYKTCIKKFYRWLRGLDEGDPEETKWIKTSIKVNHRKLPEDMLTEEDIKKLINAAKHPRDKAFVTVLYESGCRIGELGGLKIKNISFDNYGAKLLVNGKTGARRVRIISSVPYLTEWINKHPFKDDPEAYLWISYKKDHKPMNHTGMRTLLLRLKEKSGVKKPVNPHNFRHSRATYLAQYLTEAQMKEHFGWMQSSKMAAVYVHLSGKNVDRALLKVYGIKDNGEEKEVSKLVPKKCGRCGEVNEATNKFCKKCGFPLDEETKNQIIETELEQRKASEILDKMLENENFKKLFIETAKKVIKRE